MTTTCSRVRAVCALSLCAMAACDSAPAPSEPIDGGVDVDAGPPVPLDVAVEEGALRLVVETDPLRIRLEEAGAVVVELRALELGVASGGSTTWHSPIVAEPRGVSWSPLAHGVERIDARTARIRDGRGRVAQVALTDVAPGVVRLRCTVEDESAGEVALLRARLVADDGSYQGLGERFGGVDARGAIVPMQFTVADAQARTSGTNEHHVPVPFLVSSRAWGLFAQTRESGAFDVGATDPDEVRATFEGHAIDLVFFRAPTPAAVIAAYTRHTGLPRLPPRWAFAPMHWRNEWRSRDVLEEDMARIRAEGVPTTSFWIDNPWQTSYNDLEFDEARFPDSAGMLAAMRSLGFMPLVWSTPYLDAVDEGAAPANRAEELYLEARDAGHLVRLRDSVFRSPASPGDPGAMIDFTSPSARTFWQGRIAPVVSLGVRAFKLDYGEDIVPELIGTRSGFRFADGTTERETHGVYNMLYHQPYRDALDEGAPGEGGFLLVRGSVWGGQTIADIVWPGDLDNDLRVAGERDVGGLPGAISGLLSLATSGFPNYGSDTGGYRGGMPMREVLLRWAEHTALTPIMQLGGAGEHHNPWLYDDEAGEIYRRLARLHMSLVPYLRAHAIAASRDGTPPVLHPALAFPEDRAGYADPNAYLLGGDLFVAAVVESGATTRAVHVPPGAWMHWWSREVYAGPRDVTVAAPLGEPPLFMRVGALIPMLAEDLDTLVEADAPTVSPSQRPYLRVMSIPAGATTIRTEEGVLLSVERDAASTKVTIAFDGTGYSDVRMELDMTRAVPPIRSVTTITESMSEIPAAPSVDAVRAGCDGGCWFVDETTLLLSLRGAGVHTLEVR